MKCLSDGDCKVCKVISSLHEGCDIHSMTPVCDADSKVSGIQDSAEKTIAECVACKKESKFKIDISFYPYPHHSR